MNDLVTGMSDAPLNCLQNRLCVRVGTLSSHREGQRLCGWQLLALDQTISLSALHRTQGVLALMTPESRAAGMHSSESEWLLA